MKVLIIGSGGHAQIVADIVLASKGMEPLGFISRETSVGDGVQGVPVLGDDTIVPGIPHDGVVLAIGDNAVRRRVYDFYVNNGETVVSAIHPSAIIAQGVVIEPGCTVCAGVVINTGSRIGCNTILNTGCTVDHHCTVGAHAHVAPGVNLAGNVTVGDGAFVGIGACVVQGISIGAGATVGAGAAVIRDVVPGTVVVGVPASELKLSTEV